MNSSFAKELVNARKASGITQDALAKLLNVSRPMISHWENGRVLPDIDTIRRLSDVLNHDFFTIQEMLIEGVSERTSAAASDMAADLPEDVPETVPADTSAAKSRCPSRRFTMNTLLKCLSAVALSLLIILLVIVIIHWLTHTPFIQIQVVTP